MHPQIGCIFYELTVNTVDKTNLYKPGENIKCIITVNQW